MTSVASRSTASSKVSSKDAPSSKTSAVASSSTSTSSSGTPTVPVKKADFRRKVLIMGSRSVGKSSLTTQYVSPNSFSDSYYPTIESTHTKQVVHSGITYDFEIIDTAGQDEYSLFNSKYAVGIHGYILVYSIASRQSFEMVKNLWVKIVDYQGGDAICCVIVGQKSDLDGGRQVSVEEGQTFAKSKRCGFIETSAKDNKNIPEVFSILLEEMRKVYNPSAKPATRTSSPSPSNASAAVGDGSTGVEKGSSGGGAGGGGGGASWWTSWFGGGGRAK